ncbi:NAD(P)-binding protein [Natronolimnohabitans innermongolicus]|uniref:TrkA-N domain-containing protein n=1 Tax=Natronolimnohabitans innermongolicus JCM 12255 TaxID=1227499 RepID=L9X851_9EURY|nr:NAD(P)-binding protein [Natronolimnohabitans innermongolicus]ELY57591.1 TrkA-N domain-containing protein [Natronolimnohabitans innermongolicus JCM 12255]
MEDARTTDLTDHVLLLGTSELTTIIADELESTTPFLIVANDGAQSIDLESSAPVLTGDPGSRETLERAGIHDAAAAIAAAESDARDAMSVLTARKTNPSIRIAAAASNDENVAKLERAGADVVISPNTLGGHLLVKSALTGASAEAVMDGFLETD